MGKLLIDPSQLLVIFRKYIIGTAYDEGTPTTLFTPSNERVTVAVASSSALDLVDSSHLSG